MLFIYFTVDKIQRSETTVTANSHIFSDSNGCQPALQPDLSLKTYRELDIRDCIDSLRRRLMAVQFIQVHSYWKIIVRGN